LTGEISRIIILYNTNQNEEPKIFLDAKLALIVKKKLSLNVDLFRNNMDSHHSKVIITKSTLWMKIMSKKQVLDMVFPQK